MRRVNVVVTILLALAAVGLWGLLLRPMWSASVGFYQDPSVQVPCALALSAAAGLGWLLLWLSERRDRETRCRRCGYILRGLSEPRCPECGERI